MKKYYKNHKFLIFSLFFLFIYVGNAFSHGSVNFNFINDNEKEFKLEEENNEFNGKNLLLPARFPFDLTHENKDIILSCINTSLKKDSNVQVEVVGYKNFEFFLDIPKSSIQEISITEKIQNRIPIGVIRVIGESKDLFCELKETNKENEKNNTNENTQEEGELSFDFQDEKEGTSYIIFSPMDFYGKVKEANLIIYNTRQEGTEFEILEYSNAGKLLTKTNETIKVKVSKKIEDFSSKTYHVIPKTFGAKYIAYIKGVTESGKVFYKKATSSFYESTLFDAKGILVLSNISNAPVAFEYKIYDKTKIKLNGVQWIMPYSQRVIDVKEQVADLKNPIMKITTHNKFYPKECPLELDCGYTSRQDLLVGSIYDFSILSSKNILQKNLLSYGNNVFFEFKNSLKHKTQDIVIYNEGKKQDLSLFIFYDGDIREVKKFNLKRNSKLNIKFSKLNIEKEHGYISLVTPRNISVDIKETNFSNGNFLNANFLQEQTQNILDKREVSSDNVSALKIQCVEYGDIKDSDNNGLCDYEEEYFKNEDKKSGNINCNIFLDFNLLKKTLNISNDKEDEDEILEKQDNAEYDFVESKIVNCIGSNTLLSKVCKEDGIKFFINDLRFDNANGCLDYVTREDIEEEFQEVLKEYVNAISIVKSCATCVFKSLTPTDLETTKPDIVVNIYDRGISHSFYSPFPSINLSMCEAKTILQSTKGLLRKEVGHQMCMGDMYLFDKKNIFPQGLMNEGNMCLLGSEYELYLKIIAAISNDDNNDEKDKDKLFLEMKNNNLKDCCETGKKLKFFKGGIMYESECVNLKDSIDEHGVCKDSFKNQNDNSSFGQGEDFDFECKENLKKISNNKCGVCPQDRPYYKNKKSWLGGEIFSCCENQDDEIFKVGKDDVICCQKGFIACPDVCCEKKNCKGNVCEDEYGWKPFPSL